MPVAALDIGSNSFNLLIADTTTGNIKPIARVKKRVQLAAGLDADNNLSQQAMHRGMNTLREILPVLNKYGVAKLYCAATNTLRVANNRSEFLQAAETLLMQPIEVITGEQEAQYIYQAVQHEFGFKDMGLVIDIGGGSTEFAMGKGSVISRDHCFSVQAGCVTFSQNYFINGKIYAENITAAMANCQQALASIKPPFEITNISQVFGASGTVQAIALVLGEVFGGQRAIISLPELEELLKKLNKTDDIFASKLQSLEDTRLTILPAGICILTAIMRALQINALTVAQAALCEGLLLNSMHR